MENIVNKKKVKNLIPPNYYENLIKENPDEIFSNICQEKIAKWENILLKYVPNKLNDDCKILIVNFDLSFQEQIKKDIERTKVRESILMSSFTQYLEFFLTYYCKEQNIFYKQGLNEIFAPFILLKYKIKISLSEIYNLIQGLINRFLPNYFYEKETFFSLKSSLNVTTLLLKYHEPTIYNIFDNALITPEMYATNLLLTLMAHKLTLNIIYYLWDILITNNDILFIYYFIVAFLKYNSEEIINSDITILPAIITKLTIDSIDELKEIIDIAFELRKNTPHSFRILVNHLQIYKMHSNELQKCYEIIKPESLITMPIFPKEIFYICYPNVKCPDEYCDNINDDDDINKNNNNSNNNIINCEFCNFYLTNKLNYIIIDLRILEFGTFEEENEKTGFLPQMIMLEQKELKDENLAENLTERFQKDKGLYHIILLTSKTNYFNDFEDDYYTEIDNDNQLKYFQIQSKVEKELNTELTKKINKKKKFKLKEYDNLKKTLICMLKSNYPYISFAYGGFNAIHELSFKYKISLLNHDPNCDLCKKINKNSNFFIKKIKGLFKNDKKKEIIESSNNDNNNIKNNDIKNKESEIDNEPKGERFHISLFNKMVQESNYNVSACLLLEIHKKKFTKDNQIVLILKKGNLEIYRVLQKDFQFEKLDIINIKDIISINIKQKTSIATLDYLYLNEKKKKSNDFLIIEFTDLEDCKKFVFSINQLKNVIKRGKREITELEFE